MPNPYALSVRVPLPAGEKTYDLLARESAEERSASLVSLETMDDLLASLEESEEMALRTLLTESATGAEDALEVVVGESNYLVLASIIDHQTESQASEPTQPLLENLQVESGIMCDGISSKETMGHVREGLKQIAALHTLLTTPKEENEALRASLEQTVVLSEKMLGLTPTESLSEKSIEVLETLASHLYGKAFKSTPAPQEDVTPPVVETTQDTPPVVVESPLQGEEHTEVPTPSATPGLGDLRKAAAFLMTADARKSLRKFRS